LVFRFVAGWCCLAALCASCSRKQAEAPVSAAAYAVYELPLSDPTLAPRMLAGFYEETSGWRWTAPAFAVSLDTPPPTDTPTFLGLDFSAPVELMSVVHEFKLVAKVNGKKVGQGTYKKEGRYFFEAVVPPAVLRKADNKIEFELDNSFKEAETGRQKGVIAVTVSLRHREDTAVSHDAAAELARQGYKQLLDQRGLQMSAEKQNELMKLFHDLPVWRNMWIQNVQIEKNPLDLWMMQQIIYEVQPEFIVETGTWRGGSALYFAHTLNGMGLEHSRVITIDISDYTLTAAQNPLWKKYVDFFHGSSTDPAIAAEIIRRVQGHKAIVTLDSDHTMAHVLAEMNLYSPLVTKGSYLVVEDTHMDGVPTQPGFGPGPMAAVQKFLADGGSKDFKTDLSREAMVMTFNPGGWLLRK
jgi:cephalosporin hydroxylase